MAQSFTAQQLSLINSMISGGSSETLSEYVAGLSGQTSGQLLDDSVPTLADLSSSGEDSGVDYQLLYDYIDNVIGLLLPGDTPTGGGALTPRQLNALDFASFLLNSGGVVLDVVYDSASRTFRKLVLGTSGDGVNAISAQWQSVFTAVDDCD